MTDANEPISITNDEAHHRLTWSKDGASAELVYHLSGQRLTLVHTEVPEVFEGKGVGTALVRTALDWAQRDGLIVLPWCPFARRWMRAHPEALDGLHIDWESTPPAGP
jgi:predicted GNAT family acetyltransferase